MNGNKYDVVITGGGTAGVSCAWNCGINGLKTLIIEKNSFLGGSMTSSLVTPAMKTSDNTINTDFFDALYKKLSEMNAAITYSDGNKGWYNPEILKIALDSLMLEAGVEVLFESQVNTVKTKDKKILSIYIDTNDNYNNKLSKDMLLLPIESTYFVDGTGDANFCKKINCKFLKQSADEFQPINLRFIMAGINVETFSEWLMKYDIDRNTTTSCTIDGTTYISTAYTWDIGKKWALSPLFKDAIDKGILLESDSNYFQIFSVAGAKGSIAFNCPRLLNITNNRSKLYIEGRQAIYRIAEFCKHYLPGFENAYISSIANTLGVRISERVKGKYIYTYEDLISGKKFKNPVLVSNYPVDIHSNKKNSSTLQMVNQEYELPIESLISFDYDNLFIIGRCLSADFKSQAALRIIPSCFSMGEGVAKYIAKTI